MAPAPDRHYGFSTPLSRGKSTFASNEDQISLSVKCTLADMYGTVIARKFKEPFMLASAIKLTALAVTFAPLGWSLAKIDGQYYSPTSAAPYNQLPTNAGASIDGTDQI